MCFLCESDEKRPFKTDLKEFQGRKQKFTSAPISSVKDRSAVYLSKVAASDASGSTEQTVSVSCMSHISHIPHRHLWPWGQVLRLGDKGMPYTVKSTTHCSKLNSFAGQQWISDVQLYANEVCCMRNAHWEWWIIFLLRAPWSKSKEKRNKARYE